MTLIAPSMPLLAYDHLDEGERLMMAVEKMHEDEFLTAELCDDASLLHLS